MAVVEDGLLGHGAGPWRKSPIIAGCARDKEWDSGLGTRDSGLGTRDSGLGTRDSGLGTRDDVPGHLDVKRFDAKRAGFFKKKRLLLQLRRSRFFCRRGFSPDALPVTRRG
ncbi:hypothetical protein FFY77_04160 [Xanthomonas translucens pv. translucens]|nr:hypothetical protein [Xanthomonas translucens pv. translucens]